MIESFNNVIKRKAKPHQQANKAAAVDVLHAFYAKWDKSYNHVIRNLKDIEPDLLVFYNYPKQIRASIYSTNMIESFNNVIKRASLSLKQSFRLNSRLILLLASKQ
ncbi:hypothetical protein DM477_06765 [Lactobacillus helveticus]|nr:hypothetical protein DM477_06765 [Lactobacillus helveticus]